MIKVRSKTIGRDKLNDLTNGDFETIKFLEGVQADAAAGVNGANGSMDAAIAAQEAADSAADSALLAVSSASSSKSLLATLEVEQSNAPASDRALTRRIEELEVALSESANYQSALAKSVSELRDEFGSGYPLLAETAATIKAKLGITTLSGSNTGDQTLASLGAASYADGTFTATLATSGTAPTTPVTSTGYYTKVGRIVTINLSIANFTVAGATGNISINGLPFTSVSAPGVGACWSWNVGATPMVGRIDVTTTSITLCNQTDNSGIPVTNGGSQYLYITASYIA